MPLPVNIEDGGGKGNVAKVDKYGGIAVATQVPEIFPVGTINRLRYYSALLGSTGADSGTTDMAVNGSVTAQEFYIGQHRDYDIFIMGLSILMAYTSVVHNKFTGITALTNGWDLKLVESGVTTFLIEKAKTGGQVIAQAGAARPLGTGAESFELVNWVTGPPTQDAQLIYFPLAEYVPGGFRIGRGSKDKIVSVINDNVSFLNLFNVRVFGYRHYP